MDEIEQFQSWLLGKLESDVRRLRPAFAAKWDGATDPERLQAASDPAWLDALGEPILVWPDLLTALLDVELGLADLRFVADSLRQADSGEAVLFFATIGPLVISTCLDRFDQLIARSGRTGVISDPTAKQLRGYILELRRSPRLKSGRDQFAHGAFVTSDAVTGAPQRERLWDFAAMTSPGPGEPLDLATGRAGVAMPLRRSTSDALAKTAAMTNTAVARVLKELLADAMQHDASS